MKLIYKITFIVISVFTLNGCLDFDELRQNPNNPNIVPPSLIFTDVTPGPTTSFSGTYEKMQYHIWIATDNVFPPNYNNGFGGSFNYSTFRNILQLNAEAERTNTPEYVILGKFIKARTYLEMTRRMGDIPLSEAVQGADNPQPKYDSQKSVYIQCLDWLDEVNTELGAFIAENPGYVFEGDLYYNGDLKKWQKLVNAYSLRTLVSLSKKENDADLNIKSRFEAITSNPSKYPLLEGLWDNAQLEFSNEDGFRQEYNPNNGVNKEAIVLASTYIDLLIEKTDPRLMAIADPTKDALEAGSDEASVRADFNSYAGANVSEPATSNSAAKLDGDFSFPNDARFWNFVGQPGILMSYFEQELNIAEAANRGWITSDGASHYENGIRASMEFYEVPEESITEYLTNSQPYQNGAAGLKSILEQKYIAFAENSGEESFFTTRRTGVPTYLFSSENSITKYPVRWTYPTSEDIDNSINYRAALVAQFGSEIDNRDQVIWILKD